MYKHASRNLQRRHAVDKPLPTGGYVGVDSDADLIPTADNLSVADCHAEVRQLKLELAKLPNEIAAARASRDMHTVTMLGLRHQSVQARLSLVKKRLHTLVQADEYQAFCNATREIVTPEQWSEILARKDELKAAALRSPSIEAEIERLGGGA